MANKACAGTYQGEAAIWLKFGSYEAAVLPEIGANLIAFRDIEKNYEFLREPHPEEMSIFNENPSVYGIPVLFPPNRYDAGKFCLNGKTYQFPVNEAQTGNHLHGFFYKRPWDVLDFGSDEKGSYVILNQLVTEKHEVFAYFPHCFELSVKYVLNNSGLTQQFTVKNLGDSPMPCMLGFHTAIKAPFTTNSARSDCEIRLTIGERWELNERMLPTGKTQPLSENEQLMKESGVTPYFEPLDNHYSAMPVNGRNYMQLTDHKEKVRLTYDVGLNYKHWMIWNNGADQGFFCPEPQINMVNAPNVELPAETTGLLSLNSGESWSETSRFYIESI